MIAKENVPTFAAVGLATGILALLLGSYALIEARTAGVATAGLMKGNAGNDNAVEARIDALEQRSAELEKAPAPAPAPVEEPAEGDAPADAAD
jgi:hypothetical protein